MVAPIRINKSKLGYGRISAFFIAEVFAAEFYIIGVHCESVTLDVGNKLVVGGYGEAVKRCDFGRRCDLFFKSLRNIFGGFATFDRIYDICLKTRKFFVGDISVEQIDLAGSHARANAVHEKRDALLAGVGSLIELSRKILKHKAARRRRGIERSGRYVGLRFAEYRVHCARKHRVIYSFNVVTVYHAYRAQPRDLQVFVEIASEIGAFAVKAVLASDKNSINHYNLRPQMW